MYMRYLTDGSFHLLHEDRSMPIESMNSVIALGFLAVWVMVGQMSFSRT